MDAATLLGLVFFCAFLASGILSITGLISRNADVFVNAISSFVLLTLFGAVAIFSDFETELSELGQAALTGLAVAGLMELVIALKFILNGLLSSWSRQEA